MLAYISSCQEAYICIRSALLLFSELNFRINIYMYTVLYTTHESHPVVTSRYFCVHSWIEHMTDVKITEWMKNGEHKAVVQEAGKFWSRRNVAGARGVRKQNSEWVLLFRAGIYQYMGAREGWNIALLRVPIHQTIKNWSSRCRPRVGRDRNHTQL